MSNQRRALQAVKRMRQAGQDGAAIENWRTEGVNVFVDVPVPGAAQDEVARLILEVDPESSLISVNPL